MWLVRLETDYGYDSYRLYENKPIVKEDFPTERTCEMYVENEEQAVCLGVLDENVVDRLPFEVWNEPVEIKIDCLTEGVDEKEVKEKTPEFYHHSIKVNGDADPDKFLAGKKLKSIMVHNGGTESENSLIVLFDDNTYINIGLSYHEEYRVWQFVNNFEYLVDTAKGKTEIEKYPLSYGYVDNDGNYHLNSEYKNYAKLGIIKYSDEAVNLAIKQKALIQDQKDYAEYLRLKAKFEKEDEK